MRVSPRTLRRTFSDGFAWVISPPTGSGYVQYGANTIGSISCVAPVRAPAAAAPAAKK